MEITQGIRRIGAGMVNSYLVESGGEVTIVDAGAPSYWGELPAELAAMGRTLDDVRAVVLTHGHSDHIGFAERIRRERSTPILVHEADAALARGEVPNPAKGLGPVKIGPLLRFLVFSATHGLLRIPRIKEVSTYGDGATLDVPGAPRVVLLPGHTPGSAALHFAAHDAVCIGDAIATYSVTTGSISPGSRRSPRTRPRRWIHSRGWMAWTHASSCRVTARPGRAGSARRCGSCAKRRFRADERPSSRRPVSDRSGAPRG
jgi:glyoxylase-like metal-dependent hydrolase (beta-lactamase superfamily II)